MQETACKFFDNFRVPESSALIIFGASGNLTAIKLFPALFHLFRAQRLPKNQCIIGFSRTHFTSEEFRNRMKESVQKDWEAEKKKRKNAVEKDIRDMEAEFDTRISATPELESIIQNIEDAESEDRFPEEDWHKFAEQVFYHTGDGEKEGDYAGLSDTIKNICACRHLPENVLLYIATPPTAYLNIINNLEKTGFLENFRGWSRIVVEKPFGKDRESADELNAALEKIFKEDQIYRIDHYLGKETVQNILIFRFANGIFEPIWNRRYIDHVQILISESIGIEKRGKYYEKSGAFRDMVQNHMMQLLALTAMEPPISFESNAIRDEKVKVIKSIHPIRCDEVGKFTVRGQYGEGVANGINVPGYRQEANVSPDSETETYAALKIQINNWRWAGVPFYLRTGKRLPERATEIAISFKEVPFLMFSKIQPGHFDSNMLVLRIQPDEGIFLKFNVKIPGTELRIGNVNMDFSYKWAFHQRSISAYERLLLDFMLGDSSLFARKDGLEAMWNFADSIMEGWHNCHVPLFPNYAAGTWGPREADELIKKDGRSWRVP